MKLREEEFYEQYHQHGGTTIIPTEIFNELYDDATEEIEKLNNDIKELKELLEYKNDKIRRLNNIINKVYKYLDEKKDVPEWWDTDFMICMDILKGGTGYLKDVLGVDKE